MDKYPYFVYPLLEELKRETDEKKLMKIRERIAVNVGDPEALRMLFADSYESFREFYPDLRPVKTTTDATIDSFIEKFGKPGMPSAGSPLFPEEGPSDYFSYLESRDSKKPASAEMTSETADEDLKEKAGDANPNRKTGDLTVGFAKILIKNGNYGKALEIIRDIYLNNPEKSIYFADQIRFIKKMMLNEEKKKSKN